MHNEQAYHERIYRELVLITSVVELLHQHREIRPLLAELLTIFCRLLKGENGLTLWKLNDGSWRLYRYPEASAVPLRRRVPIVQRGLVRDLHHELYQSGIDTRDADAFVVGMFPTTRCYCWFPVRVFRENRGYIVVATSARAEEMWANSNATISHAIQAVADKVRERMHRMQELLLDPDFVEIDRDIVFVAHPFENFEVANFRRVLRRAFKVVRLSPDYADAYIASGHILGKICHSIQSSRLCVFDVSDWNPNVMLEWGLATGLGRPTMLLLDTRKTRGVPADLGGLDRLQYDSMQKLERELKVTIKEFLKDH